MNKRSKVIAGVLAVAVLVVAAFGASTVLAQGQTGAQPFGGFGVGRGGMMGGYGPIMDEPTFVLVAEALGVSTDSLSADVQSGKTLADIITASGKTIDEVSAYVLAERQADLDEAVADGRITQAQADLMIDRMESQIATCLETGLGAGLGGGCGWGVAQNGQQLSGNGFAGTGIGMMGRGARAGLGRFSNRAN